MEWLKKVSDNCNIHAHSTGRFSLSHFWGSALYTCVFYPVSLSQGCNLRMTGQCHLKWKRSPKNQNSPMFSKKKICHEEPCNFDQIVSLHLFYYQLEDCYKVWWGFFMLDYCSRPLNSLQRLQLTNSFFRATFAELVT